MSSRAGALPPSIFVELATSVRKPHSFPRLSPAGQSECGIIFSGQTLTCLKKRQPRLPLLIWRAAACCPFSFRFVVATQGIFSPRFAQKTGTPFLYFVHS